MKRILGLVAAFVAGFFLALGWLIFGNNDWDVDD